MNTLQHHTKRSMDWHDEPMWHARSKGRKDAHRRQTRYEQRTIREYYKRLIRQELKEAS
jgi:hypothetical protein